MRTLIKQHSASFPGPGGPPAAGGIVGGRPKPIRDGPVDSPNSAELGAADELAQLAIERIGALVEHGRENLIRRAMCRDKAFAVGLMNGDRLFDQHMQPGLERLDADGGVGIVGRHNQNRIHFARGNQLRTREKTMRRGISVEEAGIRITNGRQTALGDLARGHRLGVDLAHIAEADNSQPKILHERP